MKKNGKLDMKSEIRPVYVSNSGALFQENCLVFMQFIKDGAVDCVFADPPFNLNKSYEDTSYDDNMGSLEYEEWTKRWLFECCRILRPGGALFAYHVPAGLIKIAGYLNSIPSMKFRNWIALNMKSGFPIRNRLHPAHYGLLYYVKEGGEIKFNVVRTQTPVCRHCGKLIKDYGGYRKIFKKWEDERGIPWVQISDFWDDTRPARQYDKRRPFQINELPYEISERAILITTSEGDTVFDPFGGGGSTYYAASLNHRFWLGTEIGSTKFIVQRLVTIEGPRTSIPNELYAVFSDDESRRVLQTVAPEDRLAAKQAQQTRPPSELLLPGFCNGKHKPSHRMTNKVLAEQQNRYESR